jgi:hypothetical protein
MNRARRATSMTSADKVRENRARRTLERRGCRLQRIRRLDLHALDYGRYRIFVLADGRLALDNLTLAEVDDVVTNARRIEAEPAAAKAAGTPPRRRRAGNS